MYTTLSDLKYYFKQIEKPNEDDIMSYFNTLPIKTRSELLKE